MPLDQLPNLEQWGLTQMLLHLEDDSVADEAVPFAGTMMVQLRLDVPPGADVERTRVADLESLKSVVPSLEVVVAGESEWQGMRFEQLEWLTPDAHYELLRTLAVYVRVGDRLYTITGTHRDRRFEAIRTDLLRCAHGLARAQAS